MEKNPNKVQADDSQNPTASDTMNSGQTVKNTMSFSNQFPEKKEAELQAEYEQSDLPEQTVVNASPSELKTISQAKIITQKTEPGIESIYASIPRRYFAILVDGIIISLITAVFNLPYFTQILKAFSDSTNLAATSSLPINPNFTIPAQTDPVNIALSSIGWLVGVLYPIYFIGKSGATPGKAILKIKVVDKETDEAPGYIKAFLREFVGKFLSSILFGLGYVVAIKDKEKQTWHDKIAGTIVVRA
ncbi:MAG TPA: RDD family protein [Patescibacteria group bacterium]|nr:RDD family protein [Patescibacteria group bacterium]